MQAELSIKRKRKECRKHWNIKGKRGRWVAEPYEKPEFVNTIQKHKGKNGENRKCGNITEISQKRLQKLVK
jgi:hypothetical protein